MHDFLRALRDAAKRWPLLVGAFLCSAGVAGLWGANIAALFPIIEVTLNGDSLQSWNDRRILQSEERIAAGRTEQAQLEADLAAGRLSDSETATARNKIDTLNLARRSEEAIVYSSKNLAPGSRDSCPPIRSRRCSGWSLSWW